MDVLDFGECREVIGALAAGMEADGAEAGGDLRDCRGRETLYHFRGDHAGSALAYVDGGYRQAGDFGEVAAVEDVGACDPLYDFEATLGVGDPIYSDGLADQFLGGVYWAVYCGPA